MKVRVTLGEKRKNHPEKSVSDGLCWFVYNWPIERTKYGLASRVLLWYLEADWKRSGEGRGGISIVLQAVTEYGTSGKFQKDQRKCNGTELFRK